MMEAPSTQVAADDDRQARLSLLLGIAVWFVHLNTANALASLACHWGWFSFTVAGAPGLLFVEAALTLVAGAAMAVLIYVPWRHWRRFQTERPAGNPRLLHDTEKDRRPLLAFVAMLLNSLLLLFAVATFVPIAALNVCGQG